MGESKTKGGKMKTFIEQKNDLRGGIEELERENHRLFDTIDKNELIIAQFKEILAEVGTEVIPKENKE